MTVIELNGTVLNIRAEAKNKKQYSTILVSAIIFGISMYIVLSSTAYYVFRGETS